MPYVDYNMSLYRTGFRPYGTTNPWSATQLNGMSGFQTRPPFGRPGGGQRLGAAPRSVPWNVQRSFSPNFLHGLGQADPNCASGMPYDVNGNPCPMPSFPIPATGLPPGIVPSTPVLPTYAGCTNNGTPIPCPSGPSMAPPPQPAPMQVYTPPIMSYATAPGVSLPPGAAPRVGAPATMFPQTSPMSALTQATLIPNVPNIMLIAMAVAAFALMGSGGGRR